MRKSIASRQLPIALSALICWSFALTFPLAEVQKLGLVNQSHLLSIGSAFRDRDQELLGLCVDLLAIVFPSLIFLILPVAACTPGTLFRTQSLKLLAVSKAWAMPDVFCLSTLIAFIKLGDLATASISAGFYFLLASTFLLTYLTQKLSIPELPHRKSRAASVAYMAAAIALLIPANLLPIMVISTAQGTKSSNILSGVSELANHGLWGIAAIVFAASILVPFGKIGGLGWLSLNSPKTEIGPLHHKLHRTIDFIGRWSMLDIFLIGVLASLIEFGTLASISPGPAAPAFAAAVILTVVAVERFPFPKPS
ncbi:paraquat-inducible protein A [Pelagicoccus sp. SDUM812002]|uniref:paraquat-inducible protein A n=1 Tax=Pelagicoccus sp. SDUM812002 TaxID=3041266 RepID=UPI00280C9135|nr:paraquat-inducible protein A [Pelagicoccus sp. SDUM812002]MDQ8185856.1 paraquat-inducible protein A [Pelagicoccus sp. SDUM812002]